MPIAISGLLNPDADKAVRNIWRQMEEAGLPSGYGDLDAPPHITFAVADPSEKLGYIDLLRHTTEGLDPIQVELDAVSIFMRDSRSVAVLGVTPTPKLLAYHETLLEMLEAAGTPADRAFEQIGQWIPHCTLAHGMRYEHLSDFGKFLSSHPFQVPIHALVTKIQITQEPQSLELEMIEFGENLRKEKGTSLTN